MKTCKSGYYYCTDDEKCKRIPSGHHIGRGGYLEPDEGKKNGKNGNGSNGHSNGNGNGNGNGGNGSNGGNGGGNGGGGNGGGGMGESVRLPLNIEIPRNETEFNLGLMFRESLNYDSGMLFVFEENSQKSFHMKDTRIPLDIAFIKEDGTIESIKELKPFTLLPVYSDGDVSSALEVNRGWFAENDVNVGDKIVVPLNEDVEIHDANGNLYATVIDIIKPEPMVVPKATVQWEDPTITEAQRIQSRVGNIVRVFLRWKGQNFMLQMFFPQLKKPNRTDVINQIQKVYPGSRLLSYDIEDYDPSEPMVQVSEGSLHKWFKGSKSKDGKGGWVNVKTGGTCASDEPGEGTPKCVSSSKRASMSKAERDSASRRKKAADPNQQSKSGAAKPTYVSTDKKKMKEETQVDEACWKGYEKKGMKTMFGKRYPNCVKKTKKEEVEYATEGVKGEDKVMRKMAAQDRAQGKDKRLSKKEGEKNVANMMRKIKMSPGYTNEATDAQLKSQEKAVFELEKKEANANRAKAMKKRNNEISEKHDTPKNVKNIAKELDKAVEMHKSQASRLRKAGISEASDKKGKGSGTKDACYHKVKSRYSVWPSAYASGALVKCRKKGAANWGNSSKKESYSWRDDFEFVQEGAAWTKKEGQNKEGGLNEKGRKSYERDNPGSDLKAPSKKVGNKRRASFCARMKGMRKRQKPSNNTGDDRLSKSLRAWNC